MWFLSKVDLDSKVDLTGSSWSEEINWLIKLRLESLMRNNNNDILRHCQHLELRACSIVIERSFMRMTSSNQFYEIGLFFKITDFIVECFKRPRCIKLRMH